MTGIDGSCCGSDCCADDRAVELVSSTSDSGESLRAAVRERYASAARRAAAGSVATCGCGTSCCTDKTASWDPITSALYDEQQARGIPEAALLASLGCGNPTALAELHEGERVLDLGSGGGIDVLLSARRVGPTGRAYGLDMTDEMLELARANQRASGLENVEFLRGEIENIPLPREAVDVVISNCVINLSADKGRVLREAFRVLKPGGRFAVSDIVWTGDVPDPMRASADLWIGCVSGALQEGEYRSLLRDAGFEQIDVEPTRVYGSDDVRTMMLEAGLADEALLATVSGTVMSAFVRAVKPSRPS